LNAPAKIYRARATGTARAALNPRKTLNYFHRRADAKSADNTSAKSCDRLGSKRLRRKQPMMWARGL
jgi:hypothetical protein